LILSLIKYYSSKICFHHTLELPNRYFGRKKLKNLGKNFVRMAALCELPRIPSILKANYCNVFANKSYFILKSSRFPKWKIRINGSEIWFSDESSSSTSKPYPLQGLLTNPSHRKFVLRRFCKERKSSNTLLGLFETFANLYTIHSWTCLIVKGLFVKSPKLVCFKGIAHFLVQIYL
jgi:hypothetical protein